MTRHDFIGQYVFPLLGDSAKAGRESECQTTVVQNTGTGRLTLCYEFGPGNVIYAKLYSDALGAHSFEVQKALWDCGFSRASRHQVPEPLAFLPDHNLVLMRGVTGRPLTAALGDDSSLDLVAGVREAARWLAALHRSTIRVGEPEAEWDSLKLFRICVRLIKAAAAQPEQRDLLLNLMHSLRERVAKLPEHRPVVQTHGRYHHEHVFISPEATAVIDLDRGRPSDPAKDAAEFVRVLRLAAFKSNPNMRRADAATAAFLDEYLSALPEAEAGLSFYWSAFLMLSLFGFIKRLRAEDARWRGLMSFHQREMERAAELRP